MKKITNLLGIVIFLSLPLSLIGCKTTPKAASTPAMIEINTTPSGADIYVEGKFLGKSPVSIQAPKDYRGKESIKIEARLEGYENKIFLLGEYYPEMAKINLEISPEYWHRIFTDQSEIASMDDFMAEGIKNQADAEPLKLDASSFTAEDGYLVIRPVAAPGKEPVWDNIRVPLGRDASIRRGELPARVNFSIRIYKTSYYGK